MKVPFVVGAIPLYLIVYASMFSWWWLLTLLLGELKLVEAVLVGHALPILASVSYLGVVGERTRRWGRLVHFYMLAALAVVFFSLLVPQMGSRLKVTEVVFEENFHEALKAFPFDITSDAGPYIGIGLISAVVTIMLYPKAGLCEYPAYRRPLFVAGVVFMPLFIFLAAVNRSPFIGHELFPIRGILFGTGMVGFWASAAWLASSRTHGGYVQGLEVKPMMPFRPDMILPGGINFVKGVILMGVGTMIMIHNHLGLPRWNWWGFVLAFWGIITLIPLRGMWKMVRGRRRRMLGVPSAFGMRANWAKEAILFVGLLIMLYGFVSAFKGFVPFTIIGGLTKYQGWQGPQGWVGLALIVLSFIVLVPVRGWYKTRLLEGAETLGQIAVKTILLYLGTLLMIYGFIHFFNLPFEATDGESVWMGFYPDRNPFGFTLGLLFFIGGSLLVLLFRPVALINEFRATIRTMVGVIASLPDDRRKEVMSRRIKTLARMPDHQRRVHIQLMFQGMKALPEGLRYRLMGTNIEVLASLSDDERKKIMTEMDRAMGMLK